MPKLKTIYATPEEIPEGYADLYVDRNGQMELTGIEGVKTQADIDRVNEALRKERKDHGETKGKLSKWGDLDPETIPGQLAELDEAKAKLELVSKDGKIDETKMAAAIEAATKRAVGPLERDKLALERRLQDATKATEAAQGEVAKLNGSIVTGRIEQALRDSAAAAKVITTAIDDAVMVGVRYFEFTEDGKIVTKDGLGVTPGLKPGEWFKDMQEARPHWWPTSVGGGAGGGRGSPGSGANNPWSRDGWNITNQGKYLREHGQEKAVLAAAAVGSAIGSTKPPAAKTAA